MGGNPKLKKIIEKLEKEQLVALICFQEANFLMILSIIIIKTSRLSKNILF